MVHFNTHREVVDVLNRATPDFSWKIQWKPDTDAVILSAILLRELSFELSGVKLLEIANNSQILIDIVKKEIEKFRVNLWIWLNSWPDVEAD